MRQLIVKQFSRISRILHIAARRRIGNTAVTIALYHGTILNEHKGGRRMRMTMYMSTLAMRYLVDTACKSANMLPMGGMVIDIVESTTRKLKQHFSDNSDRLVSALRRSNDQAWQTLEIALTGDSFWDRCKSFFATGDQKAFKSEMQKCLDALSFPDVPDRDRFRRFCLSELRAAKKAGILTGGKIDPEPIANQAGEMARYSDPAALLDAEQKLLDHMAAELKAASYENLARLVAYRPRSEPLLVVAVRYFFRRAVEDDPKLFQGLAFTQLESLQSGQEQGFGLLHDLMVQHESQLSAALDELHAEIFATYQIAGAIQDEQRRQSARDETFQKAVLDLLQEQRSKGEKHDDVYDAVIQLQQRLDLMRTELRPRDSLSIRGDVERQLVKEVVSRYRTVPESQRNQLPALLNAVGKLEIAAGEFQAAQQDFAKVAEIVDDGRAKAEAHFNAYRAALERRDWSAALPEILAAAKLEPKRFEPFPLRKYRPLRILGAGGFGVAFLCHHERVHSQVVIKTLVADDLDRSLNDVFAEARVLRQMDHPAIIGLRDCDYADDAMTRPYLEMDYFESESLENYVQQHGPLPEVQAVEIANQITQALQATHARGVLHRDVKPGNVLIRRENSQWFVKLIDFGLALSTDRLMGTASSRTLRGSSIAGTIDYAAPEQMGKLPNVPVTFASDVYGFARTLCYAMFATPFPRQRHWQACSANLAALLDQCLAEQPAERPANFGEVTQRLNGSAPVQGKSTAANQPAKSQGDFWGQTADFFRKTFGPVQGKPATPPAAKPQAAPTSEGIEVIAEPKKPQPAEIMEVVPMPPPTSEGIEVIDEPPTVKPVAKKPSKDSGPGRRPNK